MQYTTSFYNQGDPFAPSAGDMAMKKVRRFYACFPGPSGDFDTMGGLLSDHFGYLPKRNEKVIIGTFEFTVLNSNSRCIQLLEVVMV